MRRKPNSLRIWGKAVRRTAKGAELPLFHHGPPVNLKPLHSGFHFVIVSNVKIFTYSVNLSIKTRTCCLAYLLVYRHDLYPSSGNAKMWMVLKEFGGCFLRFSFYKGVHHDVIAGILDSG